MSPIIFWYEVTTARSYVTTGTSNGEGWLTQPRMLAAELKRSVATAECCCSYNMLKLARHLYSWNGDSSYFDYYERSLLNMRLGTIQPKTGHTQYYVSLTPGAWKTFNTEDKSFWCCTGSGVEEYSKLNDSIYWRDEEGIFVNLFIASELDWPEKGFRLRQDTRFPEQPTTTLDRHRREARQPRDAPAHSGVDQSRLGEDQRPRHRCHADSRQLPHAEPRLESRRQDRDDAADASDASKPCRTIRRRRRSSTARWCWPAIWAAKA